MDEPTVLNLDWQLPWLADWAEVGQPVAEAWLASNNLVQALNDRQAAPVQFVPQADLPAGVAYEAFIFDHKQVPTRQNAHDFFNGLCWLRFPKTKSRLNALQAQAIAQQGVGAHRGPLRDALTLLDENAALLWASDALWQALQDKHWSRLFLAQRADWSHAKLVLFGHAALEKLIHPYKGITVHVLQAPMPKDLPDDELDTWLCQRLQTTWLHNKPFNPLPVLGIPGWCPDNENPVFYEDKTVFRD